jgi:CBS domain-containing protein
MFRKIAVGDIMTQRLVTVKPQTNLKDCAKVLVKERINSILVVEKKRLTGIVTSRDILWALTKRPNTKMEDILVKDIATKKIAVIKPSASISDAFRKMKEHKFRRLPVLSKGNLVGILSVKDILKIDPSVYHDVGDLLNIREESRKMKVAEHDDSTSEGPCEECGDFEELLKVENKYLCAGCRDSLY